MRLASTHDPSFLCLLRETASTSSLLDRTAFGGLARSSLLNVISFISPPMEVLTRHSWKRWSADYFSSLRKFTKWHTPVRNLQVGDVVMLKEERFTPTKWPLGRITTVHPGKDGYVRVATVRTAKSTYKRPVVKLALILPTDS